MNFRDLQALQALVKSGTTKGAAVNIGVSQPTISRAIVEVETHFKRQLFARRHGRLVPTPAALRIGRSVDQISGILDILQSDLDQLETEQVLRVGVSLDSNGCLIQQALKRFASMHRGVVVRVELMNDLDLSRAISRGMIDLGLSCSPEMSEETSVEPVFTQQLCCILPARHRLENAPFVTPDMLAGEPVIAIRNNQTWSRKVASAFREAGVMLPHHLEVSSAPLACEYVSSGMGVAFCAPFDLTKSNNPILLKPFLPAIECKLFSVVHVTGPMHQAARQFSRLVRMTNRVGGSDLDTERLDDGAQSVVGLVDPAVLLGVPKQVAVRRLRNAAVAGTA